MSEITNEIDVVTPENAGLASVTAEDVAQDDSFILWDHDAQLWRRLTVNSLSGIQLNTVGSLHNPLNISSTNDYNSATTEAVAFDGSAVKSIYTYIPDQSVNSDSTVSFKKLKIQDGIYADQVALNLIGSTVNIGGSSIRFFDEDLKVKASIVANLTGTASNASKVTNTLTLYSIDSATKSKTSVFDGSAGIEFNVYTPDQTVNSTSDVKFNSVTSSLVGNADSATKVSHTLSITGTNTFVDGSALEVAFDGSSTVSKSLYIPNQEVNTTSSVTFGSSTIGSATIADENVTNSVIKTLTVTGVIKAASVEATQAALALKTYGTLTNKSTSVLSDATSTDVTFNGSSDTSFTSYKPNQSINTTDDVSFNSISSPTASLTTLTSKEVDIAYNGTTVGTIKVDTDGKSYAQINTFTGSLVGNATSADKVNNTLTVNTIRSTDNSVLSTSSYNGSTNSTISIKDYDTALSNEIVARAQAITALQEQVTSNATKIANINSFEVEIVSTVDDLPIDGANEGIIYLVPDSKGTTDAYTEYIWVTSKKKWENIGTTATELNNYTPLTTFNEFVSKNTTQTSTDEAALQTEIVNRTNADNTLQANITTEAAARTAADATIQTRLGTDESNTDTAIATLKNSIANETDARKNADSTNYSSLNTLISTESTTRAKADTTLQTNIDSLNFVVSAKTDSDNNLVIVNRDATTQTVTLSPKLTAGTNITIGDDNKINAPNYTAGNNVQISSNYVISATDTTYSAGTNITINSENKISLTLPTGFTYTQAEDTAEPSTLFGGTWELVSALNESNILNVWRLTE